MIPFKGAEPNIQCGLEVTKPKSAVTPLTGFGYLWVTLNIDLHLKKIY